MIPKKEKYIHIKRSLMGAFRYDNALPIKVLLFAFAAFITVMLMPSNYSFKYDFNKGQPWKYEDLSAPFDFALKKDESLLRSERELIRQTNRLYFRYDETVSSQVLRRYDDNFHSVFSSYEDTGIVDDLYDDLRRDIQNILSRGVVSDASSAVPRNKNEIVSVVKKSGEEKEVIFSELYTLNQAAEQLRQKAIRYGASAEMAGRVEELFYAVVSPNVLYDVDITETALSEKLSGISPNYGFVPRGRHIVSDGEPVSEHTYVVLSSLRDVYNTQNVNSLMSTYGYIIIVLVVYGLLFWLLTVFKRGKFFHVKAISMILTNIILNVFMCYVVTRFSNAAIYIVPICLQTILLRSFMNARVAFMAHITAVILCSFLAPNVYVFLLVWIITGIACAFSDPDIYHRSKIFISVARIVIISILVAVGSMMIQNSVSVASVMSMCGYLLISGVLMLFVQPLIYVHEKCFDMVSDISLLELTDTNSPLLRMLSQKAPGTFQHSLAVANIAEQAAREMSTNALLVRVAALYHDVGKVKNPAFFIENQGPHYNPHDNLPPQESARIIKNHVSDGLELAKKYGIPPVVSHFMKTHHGRSLVFYFYKKACQMYGEENVDEADYRYSYEKPSTKSEAILMICDSVEAASRSLKVYSQETITAMVASVVERQMADGQFDDAEISYKEINRLKAILVEKLLEVYHSRIEYQKD